MAYPCASGHKHLREQMQEQNYKNMPNQPCTLPQIPLNKESFKNNNGPETSFQAIFL